MKSVLSYFGILFLCLLGILHQQCANPVSPTGGPRDTRPPQVDSSKTFPNFSTNFKEDEIVLHFEEWIKLNDASNQIIISPFLEEKPNIQLRGKSVKIKFKDSLKENTTYTIAFGNSIQTLKESKADENFKIVFSTGPEIDSLRLSGTVVNALDKEPVEDFYVLLYDQLEDSVIFSQRPFYFAKTDKQGNFKIDNIKPDTFRVFALKDNNFNYNFDLPSEEIGFIKEPVILTDSTNAPIFKIPVFQEAQSLKLIGKQAISPGLIRVRFNQKPVFPVDIKLSPNEASAIKHVDAKGDSMFVWLTVFDKEQEFILSGEQAFLDTFSLRLPSKEKLKAPKPAFRKVAQAPRGTNSGKGGGKGAPPIPSNNTNKDTKKPSLTFSQNPDENIRLEITQPLSASDLSKISVVVDSTETVSLDKISIDSADSRFLIIEYPWQEEKTYAFRFEAGAIESVYGLKNEAFSLNFLMSSRKSFGSIVAKVSEMDAEKSYLIELLNVKEDVLDQVLVKGETSFEKTYTGMEVKSYMIRVLEDDNQNRRWDTGNYREGRQAEALYFSGSKAMRPNWDMELEIILPKKE